MKYFFTSVCLIFSIVGLLAQEGHEINVKVKGFEESEAYLAYYYGEKQYIKDTVQSVNGSFQFTGEEPLAGGIYLVVLPPKNNYFELIVDKDQHFRVETDTADYIKNMKIKGSKENELFYSDMILLGDSRIRAEKLNAELQELGEGEEDRKAKIQAELKGINEKVQSSRTTLMNEHPEMLYSKVLKGMKDPVVPEELQADRAASFYYYRDNYFNDLDLTDDRLLRTPVMYNRVNTYIENLTVKHPDSINKSIDLIFDKTRANPDVFQYFVISFITKYSPSLDENGKLKPRMMGSDASMVHIIENVYMKGDAWWADSAKVAQFTQRALEISPTLLGRIAPDFRAQEDNGKWTNLHSVTAKYTLLYFWSYDCGVCQKATPVLSEIYKEYKDKDVALFAVSINGDVEVWKEKIEKYGLGEGINVQDHGRRSGFDAMYDITSTPRVFVLDENKKIIAKQITVDQIRDVLNHEFGIEEEAN